MAPAGPVQVIKYLPLRRFPLPPGCGSVCELCLEQSWTECRRVHLSLLSPSASSLLTAVVPVNAGAPMTRVPLPFAGAAGRGSSWGSSGKPVKTLIAWSNRMLPHAPTMSHPSCGNSSCIGVKSVSAERVSPSLFTPWVFTFVNHNHCCFTAAFRRLQPECGA